MLSDMLLFRNGTFPPLDCIINPAYYCELQTFIMLEQS